MDQTPRPDSLGNVADLPGEPRQFDQRLRLLDAVMIVAGSMIGSGIFIVSADISRTVASPAGLLGIWLLTGLMTIVGALCYGELAGMMPKVGGQYVFLKEAYSPLFGFLYGWTLFLVIQTGTIAAVAVAFAKFLGVLWHWASDKNIVWTLPLSGDTTFNVSGAQVVGIGVVLLLTLINCNGISLAKLVQSVFTLTKVGALAALILLGLTLGFNKQAFTANMQNFWGDQPLSGALLMAAGGAMVGSLFSADAWHSVAFAAAEVQNPKRNLPLSLAIGTTLVIVLYLLANVAYLVAIPLEGTKAGADVLARGIQHANDDRVGTALMEAALGRSGAVIMAVAIMISTFGCANGLVLSGARVYYAMAQDGLFFKSVGTLSQRRVPAVGLILQGVWACVLTLSGTYGSLLDYVIFAALAFYALTVGGLFMLRIRKPHAERPYKAIGYPVLPALYIIVAVVIMVDLLFVKPYYTWPGLIIVATGIPVYYFWHGRQARQTA